MRDRALEGISKLLVLRVIMALGFVSSGILLPSPGVAFGISKTGACEQCRTRNATTVYVVDQHFTSGSF